jgi:hypothetical protein
VHVAVVAIEALAERASQQCSSVAGAVNVAGSVTVIVKSTLSLVLAERVALLDDGFIA